jgi:hypothetical protein
VRQGGRLLGSYRLRRLVPNRSHAFPSDWLHRVRGEEEVCISVTGHTEEVAP